ncbi:MAG: tRNA lysidine(34) synthetase TilS [Clostridia bacterium]|nr:tRNA lysidine(34) synthetase TilS [Clostridia bacterium]
MMEKKIEAAVSAFNLEKAYGNIIIGFSGGADSSALLHYFSSRAKRVRAVHINHMIRGGEADRDEAFCKSVCERYGVEFVSYKIDIPAIAKASGRGIELTAREERYRVFENELENGFDAVLTAHNANDNTESVIFNLARGSGLNGICGINPNLNGKILRPLIYVTRDEIISYCLANNIEYVTDSTNSDTDYTRNYIRHIVVPNMEKLNPSLNTAVSRLVSNARADSEFIELCVNEFISSNVCLGKINTEQFCKLHKAVASRVLKRVSGKNLDYSSINTCISLAQNGSCGDTCNILEGISFKKEHSYLAFVRTKELERISFRYELREGVNDIAKIEEIIAVSFKIDGKEPYFEINLDKSKIKGALFVRSRAEADKILCGKMNKRLKKLLCEKHIASHLRDRIPILCDDNGILAIPNVASRDGIKSIGDGILVSFYKV